MKLSLIALALALFGTSNALQLSKENHNLSKKPLHACSMITDCAQWQYCKDGQCRATS